MAPAGIGQDRHLGIVGPIAELVDRQAEGAARLAPVVMDALPEAVLLHLGRTRGREIVARKLARPQLAGIVDLEQQLEALFELETFSGRDRLEPVRQFLQRLDRVLRGQVVQEPLGFLRIRHGMVRLAAAEQLQHLGLSRFSGRIRAHQGCARVDKRPKPWMMLRPGAAVQPWLQSMTLFTGRPVPSHTCVSCSSTNPPRPEAAEHPVPRERAPRHRRLRPRQGPLRRVEPDPARRAPRDTALHEPRAVHRIPGRPAFRPV